jgi:hypothetical protein
MKRILQLAIILLSIISTVVAQSGEGGGVYILNNGTLVNCVVTNNYALTGFGVSGTSGNVTNCNINDNFYLNTSIVNPGDMLMNDGTVYSPVYDIYGNLVFPTGYSASNVSGVCFWGNANNNYLDGRFWVISVDEVTLNWCPNGMTGSSGYNPIDIAGIFDYSTPSSALFDYNGSGNTNLIVTEPGFVQNPTMSYALTTANCAAEYCYQYLKVAGKPAIWFLPAIGQLRTLDNALTVINPILSKLGKTQITANWYWSSDEFSQQQAWAYWFPSTSNQPANTNKESNARVRPMAIVSKSN